MSQITVRRVFVKPASGAPMIEPINQTLNIKAGYGIEGDKNAHPFSPRQILIVRQEDLEAFKIPPGELRENVILAGCTEADFQPGGLLTLGDAVKIRLTFHCEPCKRISHVIPHLKSILGHRGVLGVALTDGRISAGQPVRVTPRAYPELSAIPYQRFLGFIARVPKGKVVTYKQVVIGMGVAGSYMRAIPKYIQQTDAARYPVHRIVDSDGRLIVSYVPTQPEALRSENVRLNGSGLCSHVADMAVDLHVACWNNEPVFLSL
ncbi:MAG TPA: MOSC domain-containing protein [Blastocatellia bacterium]|nr:MOSC domain-containing protein [Blastocatellia bacterium]